MPKNTGAELIGWLALCTLELATCISLEFAFLHVGQLAYVALAIRLITCCILLTALWGAGPATSHLQFETSCAACDFESLLHYSDSAHFLVDFVNSSRMSSATQQTPELEQELAEQGLCPTDPTDERREALEELRRRFDTVDSEPLSRFRDDVAVPRTTDQLHVYFKQMQDERFYYPHSQLACATIEALLPDHLHYFQAHREDFNFYGEYLDHYWGSFYSVFDSEVYTDLPSEFAHKGF